MLIELYLAQAVEPVGDIGTFYIETDDEEVIKEFKKYKCPMRLVKYMDEVLESNKNVKELVKLKPGQKIDHFINLSHISDKNLKDGLSPFMDEYLKQTDHLDEYGNEIEKSDLTEGSDRGYEMKLDDLIYKK